MFDFQGLVLHHPVEFNASAFTVGKGISPAEKGKGTFSDRVGNNELTSGIDIPKAIEYFEKSTENMWSTYQHGRLYLS